MTYRLFRYLLLAVLPLTMSGCISVFFATNQKVKFNLGDKDVNVKIRSERLGGYRDYNHEESFTATDSTLDVKLKKTASEYTVVLSKPGYRSRTYRINKNGINGTRLLDVGLGFGFLGGGIALSIANGSPTAFYVAMCFTGAFELGYTLFTKGWLKYKSSYDFEPLIKNPEWNESLPKIMVDSANIKIDKKGLKSSYFSSIKDYEKNKSTSYSTSYDGRIIVNNTSLSEDLNEVIVEAGFQDTISEAFRDLSKYCRLSCDIKTIDMIFAGNSSCVKMTVKWTLLDYYTSVPYAVFNDECETQWEPAIYNTEGYSNAIVKGLKESLYDLLSDEKNAETFKNAKKSLSGKEDVASTVVIDSVYRSKTTVGNSARAVVTIITRKGHGSGCVISQEGYIVSNYHVVENDTTGCRAVLSTGGKLPYEIVALDPGNDLALIKVRKPLEHALSLNFREAAVGEEVFAIGTPADVELGQTVTKGVISGYRSITNKKYYQTDASINSGNSGGALISKTGELLGIVNAKVMGAEVQGIGFVIPLLRTKDRLISTFK